VSAADALTLVGIVGAGPVGLALALGLARHGVRTVVVEKNDSTSRYSKAPAIHVRTREVLRLWRVEQRFLEAGVLKPVLEMHDSRPNGGLLLTIDFAAIDDESDRPGLLVLEQGRTEALLLQAAQETGLCEVRFGTEAVGMSLRPERVTLTLRADGRDSSIDSSFVVGCDGAKSNVRDALGLPFDGVTYPVRPMLADVRIGDQRDALPWPRITNASDGIAFTARLSPGLWRIVRIERGEPSQSDEVPDAEVRRCVDELLGPGAFDVVWSSRFRIHRRSAPRFRIGRVLLAGDAAHVHSPAGGQGMNAGIQDAHNLAWKLALALRRADGTADRLLDSYDVERRAVVVGDVSSQTNILTRVLMQTPATIRDVVFTLVRVALRVPRLRRAALRRATMIDLDYPASPILNSGERKAGIRLPDVMLRSPDGEDVRLYSLLPDGPALISIERQGEPAPHLSDVGVDTVIRVGAGSFGDPRGVLHRLLGIDRAAVVLVRPDAHIAFVRDARHDRGGFGDAVQRALGA
jgi:2-polyprenyl-6-methoxyphenol hydroxylase-like FAD-dependent oxidoreductase